MLGVRHRNGKSLREYISRFNLNALEIVNLTILDTIQAILKGIKEGPLQLSFSKKSPRVITDLLSRVEKYINLEETLEFITRIKVPELDPIIELGLKKKDDE